jgi:hypothetical protein
MIIRCLKAWWRLNLTYLTKDWGYMGKIETTKQNGGLKKMEIIIKNDEELKNIKNDGNIYVLNGVFKELKNFNFDKSFIKVFDSKIELINNSTINSVCEGKW